MPCLCHHPWHFAQARLRNLRRQGDAFLTAAREGNFARMKAYLEHGGTLGYSGRNGWCALHEACAAGQVEVVLWLLRRRRKDASLLVDARNKVPTLHA